MKSLAVLMLFFASSFARADQLYKFTICNHIMPVLAAAVVWKDPNTLEGKSQGWWAVPFNKCVVIGNFPQRIFAYLEGGVPHSDKPTTIVNPHTNPLAKFCVDPHNQFLKRGAEIRCDPPNQRDFNHFDFSVDSTVWDIRAVTP